MIANVATVPVELLQHASEVILHGETSDPYKFLPALYEFATPDQILAASHRVRALLNLIYSDIEVAFWIKRRRFAEPLLDEALFRAAAIAPLVIETPTTPDRLRFDLTALQQTALAVSTPAGHA